MTMQRWISLYWGKAHPNPASNEDWHPLAYHSLDVAAAMAALLDIRPQLLAAIAKGARLSLEDARCILVLIAAFHDLGKFAENFQIKAESVQLKINPSTDFTPHCGQGHGGVGLGLWENIFQTKETLAALSRSLGPWMKAACAHHGAPVDSEGFHLGEAMSSVAQTDALAFVEDCTKFMRIPDAAVDGRDEVWRVAGLVILADWIGSNQTWFPYEPPTKSLSNYWSMAQEKAAAAVRQANLQEAPVAPSLNLSNLIDGAEPSPLQSFALNERPPNLPTLYIVEDLTGSGKTEAALILAHRIMAAGQAEGIYWALPSMATANALYERLSKIYRHLFASGHQPSLVLAHGARDLNDLFTDSIQSMGGSYGLDGSADDMSAEAQCAAFIADDVKKTFLAQIGIGTIDQALLSVLPVRHQALRLCALSRRVLVVDEAHAYDPYMQAELARLLEFHGALGGSAIVLSATLTQGQRRNLARRYLRTSGGGLPNVKAVKLTSIDFPLVTRVTANDLVESPQEPARGTRRDLPIRRFDTPDQAMTYLLNGAKAGLCGVYIRNTVKDAIQAASDLRALAGEGVTVDLFHARFAMGDRLAHENNVLTRFGKQSTAEQRQGRLLIATQVVEQSLDVDFDIMVSDLCPMDLLIQRAGRLHRHGHRPTRPLPILGIVAPAADVHVAPDWYARLFPHGQYVYPDVGQLWRTMAILEERGGLPLSSLSPRALIEPVFGDDPEPLPEALESDSRKAESKRGAENAIGRLNSLERSHGFSRQAGAWDSDVRTPTRLGEVSVRVRLARWKHGCLTPWFADPQPWRAWRLSEVSLRAGQIGEVIPPDTAATKAMEDVRAGWPDRYDPPLLLPLTATDDPEVWRAEWADEHGSVHELRYSAQGGLQQWLNSVG